MFYNMFSRTILLILQLKIRQHIIFSMLSGHDLAHEFRRGGIHTGRGSSVFDESA